MRDNDLKKLNRVELLKMLIDQMTENERLQEENARLKKQVADRKIAIRSCGSIAEAALEVNGVFEAAEAAAKQYLENVKTASDKASQLITDAKQEAKKILDQAQAESTKILSSANWEAKMIRELAMQILDSYGTDKVGEKP